eukprot:1750671-Prymnesium_polylepis.1
MVTDLAPLGELNQLQSLFLGSTQIADVSPLRSLENLRYLDVNNTRVHDLSSISCLTNLEELDVGRTYRVTDLSPIIRLDKLTQLHIGDHSPFDLTPLTDPRALQIHPWDTFGSWHQGWWFDNFGLKLLSGVGW